MANDMVAALARATTDGQTLFGHNSNRPHGEPTSLVRRPGRDHAPGERVRTTHIDLPQARHTFAVLAGRAGSSWGYQHGVNEKGVTAGYTPIRTRLLNDSPGLTGPDLVRLVLERAGTALQAVEVLTDLIGRHGQGAFVGAGENDPDAALLVADCREAHVVEAAGRHWALATVGTVRAVSDACFLRQDWDRISPGLSALAIHRGWWPEDGCKLDFARAIGRPDTDPTTAMRRWGLATIQLEQHSGSIDVALLRGLLRAQSEAVCPLDGPPRDVETATSFIVRLGKERESLPLAWCAFGPPTLSVYLPVVPVAELPVALGDGTDAGSALGRGLAEWRDICKQDGRLRETLHSALAGVQEQLDEHAQEFFPEAEALHRRGEAGELQRFSRAFMQHVCERMEELAISLRNRRISTLVSRKEEKAVMPGAEF